MGNMAASELGELVQLCSMVESRAQAGLSSGPCHVPCPVADMVFPRLARSEESAGRVQTGSRVLPQNYQIRISRRANPLWVGETKLAVQVQALLARLAVRARNVAPAPSVGCILSCGPV